MDGGLRSEMATDPEVRKTVTRIIVWGSLIMFVFLEIRNGFAVTQAIAGVFTNG